MTATSVNQYKMFTPIVGSEPPIEAGDVRHLPSDWHRISLRWLSGTIIAGLAGAALIGAAVYTALDRQANFAEMPVFVQNIRKETAVPAGAAVSKGDRLVRPVDIVAAKQIYRVTTPVKLGDKEILTSRAFTRVATPLTLTPTAFAEDVPDFDPLKLLTGTKDNPELAQDQTPTIDAAEVSLANRDMAGSESFRSDISLSAEEAKAQIIEQLRAAAAGAKAALSLAPQMLLMRTSRASMGLSPTGLAVSPLNPARNQAVSDTAFSSIDVRMVPENVSIIPRIETQPNTTQMNERLVIVHKNESLEDILRANQVEKDLIKAVTLAIPPKVGTSFVHAGQRVKLLFADLEGDNKATSLARISVYTDETLEAMLARTDSGDFTPVQVQQPAPANATPTADAEPDEDTGGMRLYNALYETALKQDLPKSVIDDLTVIFSNSVDFQRAVAAGDAFETLYSNGEDGEPKGELLYASITAHNETFKFYRFQSPDDNITDYYDENGKSGRKFLIRKPIASGEERSGFGMRRHPIFGYMKMHTGVDWAAPTGTPIFAAGNGVIIKAAWTSGYGRRVEIQHTGGYVTTYNHMSGFGRSITEGAHVKQGQIVGYVGATGNVTGAHLHYEVVINGRFVDPLGIRLPRTRELDGKILVGFKKEEQRIDDIVSKAPNVEQQASKN
eukprot:gene7404-7468_t